MKLFKRGELWPAVVILALLSVAWMLPVGTVDAASGLTIEDVFGAGPVSEDYRGNPNQGAWQAARNDWARISDSFGGVKAIIDPQGAITSPDPETLSARQRAQLVAAQRIASKLQSDVYVVAWDWAHGKIHVLTEDVTARGSSDTNSNLREVRPLRFSIDRFTGDFPAETDKLIVVELGKLILKHGRAILLADDGLLPHKVRKRNNELIFLQDAEQGAGLDELASL